MSLYVPFFFILINLRECKSVLLKGKRADDGQFPWLIQFQTVAPCGGVLLSPDWILTAAQCVQDKRNSIILFATGLNGSDSKQAIPVKATYIYPTYQAYSAVPDRDYNIALLKLTKPFDMCPNETTFPNVIPMKYDDNYKLCLIFGWQSYVSPSSKVLAKPIQYHDVMLNSWKMCTYMIKANANYTNVFCAMVEYEDEMKACAGNPGSPVVCENQNHEAALVGIASWTNFSLECGYLPTYLYLGAFRVWIDGLVFNNKHKEELKCNNNSTEEECKSNLDLLHLGSHTSYALQNIKMKPHNLSQALSKNQKASTQSEEKPHSWNQFYPATFNNINDADMSFSNAYPETTNADVIKDQMNNIYKYEEIGGSKKGKQFIDKWNKQDALNDLYSNVSIHKIMVKQDKDHTEVDDFDILLPFSLEDITMSYSNIINVYSMNLYMIFHFIFWYYYIIIYI